MNKLLIILITSLLINGCASIDPTAFSPDKTYAVAIVGIDTKLRSVGGTGSAKQAIPIGSYENTRKAKSTSLIANKIAAQYVNGLKKHAPIKIISGKSVTNHKKYRRFKSIDNGGIGKKFVAAQTYHNYWTDDFNRMPELARQLGVDGVILIYITPAYFSKGTGVDYRGRKRGVYKPVVETFIEAYSTEGKRVVRYNLRYKPDEEIMVRQDAGHLVKLRDAIAEKHAYNAGVDTAKRIWGNAGT